MSFGYLYLLLKCLLNHPGFKGTIFHKIDMIKLNLQLLKARSTRNKIYNYIYIGKIYQNEAYKKKNIKIKLKFNLKVLILQ